MNIPQGYKQTELGIIPEDWEVKTFGNLGIFSKGSGVSRNEANSGKTPCVRYGELYTHHHDYIKTFNSFISVQVAKNAKAIKFGDVLFAASGETKEEIGKSVAFVDCFDAFAGGDIIILSTNPQLCDAKYIGYISNSIPVCKQKVARGQGDAVVHITSDSIKNIVLPLPPIAEQRAIAEALSDVDGLIAALDKKIAKKRLVKQGAMQQLLTGQKRLPGFTDEWVEKKLGEISHITTGKKDVNEGCEHGKYPFFTCSTSIARSDSYSFDKEAILIAGNGDVGNMHYFNGKFEAYQRTYVLSDFKIDTFYTLHYMDAFLISSLNEGKVGSTIPYIVLGQLQDFVIKVPKIIKEQQAIATILSDMDKEIADLEARRDKYRLLKSGMMQKLLTGQIRLTQKQAKIISAVREIPLDAHIIAGHIVNRSYQSRGWGRTKLQKSLHLVGYCTQLNLGNEYIRNTAGPDDQQLMNYIDQKFRQYRHVDKVCEKLPDGRTHYTYTPTAMIQDIEIAYEKYPKELRDQIDALIDKLNTMDLAGTEILSTLYAVWNNRIIKGEQITDDLLIADFYAWSTHKADFERGRVRKALNYMRGNNIIPVGWGKYIGKR